jgi:hypothetical protein
VKPAELLVAREALARHALPPEQRQLMLLETEDRRVAKMPSGARIDWNQGDYILDKWTRKGWWEYGVSARSGWLTPKGVEALSLAIEQGANP